MSRETSRGWYLVGIGLIASAAAIAIMGFFQMADSVRGLQRVVMPGRAEVTLAAGRSIVYFETRSTVDGRSYATSEAVDIRCSLHDLQGTPVTLQAPKANVRYSLGDHAGHNVFDVDVPAPATYLLECEGDGPYVLAIGGGLGAWLVVALVGGLVPASGGLVVCLIVFFKRRRQRARAG